MNIYRRISDLASGPVDFLCDFYDLNQLFLIAFKSHFDTLLCSVV